MKIYLMSILAIGWLVDPEIAIQLDDGPAASPDHFSQLWGREGELWSEGSRLPDFSHAGYHEGDRPLPDPPTATVNVRDFGALGDGMTDDTLAFQRALKAAQGRALAVPSGRYVIRDFLVIDTSATTIIGRGSDRSILVFPKPLQEIRPNMSQTTTGRPTSNYSWSGGFLSVRGQMSSAVLSEVNRPARRGQRSLKVDRVDRLRRGQQIRLELRDTPENSLAQHLYAGDSGPIGKLRGSLKTQFLATIVEIDQDARTIRLDRGLRTDVRLEWQPRLFLARSSVEEVGIEGLGFEFPVQPYQGHFTELGFNAISLSGVRNCWIRDVLIRNADSGIFVRGYQNTLTQVVLESQRQPDSSRNSTGHHGISLGGGSDNLVTNFDFRTRFIHDFTVSGGAAGNVIMDGRGVDLSLDHHRRAPHSNLWTNLDAGQGTRLFHSGGGDQLGWHSAAWETFWAIRTDQPQGWPTTRWKSQWGPELINVVGLDSPEPAQRSPEGRWFEPSQQIAPVNLYRAQRDR